MKFNLKLLAAAAMIFAVGAGAGIAAHRVYKFQPQSHAQIRNGIILSHARQARHDIVIVGDSHVERADISTLCGHHVLNMGYAGARIKMLAEMAPESFLIVKPKLVIIAGGINDTAYDQMTEPSAFLENYRRVVAAAKAVGAAVVALDIPPIGSDSFPVTARFDRSRLALVNKSVRQAGVPILQVKRALSTPGQEMLAAENTTDGVHFSAKGYRIWKRVLNGACAHFPSAKAA